MEKTSTSKPAPDPGKIPPHPDRRPSLQLPRVTAWQKTAGITVAGLAVIAALAAIGVSLSVPPAAEVQPAATGHTTVSPDEARRTAGYKFLATWVDEDGRVVRRDQGNDTVSEGQAYGMLIALGVTDESKFDSIWIWTRQHLLRPDGLLAWRWINGAVADDAPAADADLDVARALVQAGTVFGRPDLTEAGNTLGTKVMDFLTAATPRGRIIVPGLWAATGPDRLYNPSYASPAAFEVLGKSTGDPRWKELQLGARAMTESLLRLSPLPPDWAQVSSTGEVHAVPAPAGQGSPIQYGYDAARLPIRFSESCTAEDVVLAGAIAPTLNGANPIVAVLDLSGSPASSDQNAVAYSARAAARAASGDYAGARKDLDSAEDVNSLYPTYYGSAWHALARDFLDSEVLGGCPPLAGR